MRKAALISIACTLFSLLIHILPFNSSMINLHSKDYNVERKLISNDYISESVELHKTLAAFEKRPLTTGLVDALAATPLFNRGTAFTFINFSFLFLCGLLIYYLGLQLTQNEKEAQTAIYGFFFGFTILFAFFPTVYTYDEPIQYLFLFIGFLALLHRQWLLYILGFSLSLIGRESTLILMPSIFLFLLATKNEAGSWWNTANLKRLLLFCIPAMIYFIYLFAFLHFNQGSGEATVDELNRRLPLFEFNFQNAQFAAESLLSLVVALGFHLYFFIHFALKNKLQAIEKRMIYAFLFSLIINTLIVFTSTRAREARLFALPLLFLWPYMGKYLLSTLAVFKDKSSIIAFIKRWPYALTLFFAAVLLFLFSEFVYRHTGTGRAGNFHNEYLFIMSFFVFFHLCFLFYRKRRGIENQLD